MSRHDGLKKENRLRSGPCFTIFFLVGFFTWNIFCCAAFAQEDNKSKPDDEEAVEGEEKFTNYGLISVSNKGKLSEDRKHVAFNIINNTGRSISNLFGWVYQYEEKTTGEEDREEGKSTSEETTGSTERKEGKGRGAKGYFLTNYPHKGGVLVMGRFHKPGKKAKWRFILRRVVPPEIMPKFLLLVNMSSIFFAKVEISEPTQFPPEAEEETAGEGKTNEPEEQSNSK